LVTTAPDPDRRSIRFCHDKTMNGDYQLRMT